MSGWDGYGEDLKCAIRIAAASPGFAAGIVMTMFVGMGLTMGVFNFINVMLSHPFPYEQTDRIVASVNVRTKPQALPHCPTPMDGATNGEQ
jgi:hypothetical protein